MVDRPLGAAAGGLNRRGASLSGLLNRVPSHPKVLLSSASRGRPTTPSSSVPSWPPGPPTAGTGTSPNLRLHTVQMADRELSDTEKALLDHLYQENAKVAAVFWDWRHKLMAFTFTVVSGLAAVGTWASSRQVNRFAVAGAFFVAAVLSLSTALLNKRTGEIVEKTYVAGAALEKAIKMQVGDTLAGHDLMFTLMKDDKESERSGRNFITRLTKPTFGWVLSGAYLAMTFAFLAIAIALII